VGKDKEQESEAGSIHSPVGAQFGRLLEKQKRARRGKKGEKASTVFSPLLALLALLCRKTAPAIRPSTRMN
jgi:hypothetical protein